MRRRFAVSVVASSSALTRVLGNEKYEILTARNAEESFELLARHEVGVIVTDYAMPGMDGNQFLARVQSLYPHITRIMLSGRCDMTSVIAAVNEGRIYKFLEKPSSATVLRQTLHDAFVLYDQQRGGTGEHALVGNQRKLVGV